MRTVPADHSMPGRENGKRVLPPAVASLVDQIRKTLTVRTDPKNWEQIQFRRVMNTPYSSVLLCGTALIDQTNAETRILIVMSEVGIGAWHDTVIVQAKGPMVLEQSCALVPVRCQNTITHHDLW